MVMRSRNVCELAPDDIHVWTACLTKDDDVTAELFELLDCHERSRADQFLLPECRRRFVQSHGILRSVLSQYVDCDPALLGFACNANGKPFVLRSGSRVQLEFSLSQSGSCCMLALRRRRPVGIDVEEMTEIPRAMSFAGRVFAPAECEFLRDFNEAEQQKLLLILWTCKEAVTKALGLNLASMLKKVSVTLDEEGRVRVRSIGSDLSIINKYSIVRVNPLPGYLAALATHRSFTRLQQWSWSYLNF